MSSVSPLEHTAIGGLAGIAEICVMQPTVAIKNALQEGRPVPRQIPVLYRGLGINAAATFPITAAQFGVARLLEKTYVDSTGAAPGAAATIGIAMTAGATSALIACPAELLMIQQQKSGLDLSVQARALVREFGVTKLFKGLSANMMRESMYAAGYLGIAPLLRMELAETDTFRDTPGAALAISGVTAGLLATVASHPADTIKTKMQAFPNSAEVPQYASFFSTMRTVVAQEGVGALFAGLAPRAFRVCGAVFILTGVRSALVDLVEEHHQTSAVKAQQA